MAEKARLEQEALERRVVALEAALAEAQKPHAKARPAGKRQERPDHTD
jgi:BMFP domain-containing protein YqiC